MAVYCQLLVCAALLTYFFTYIQEFASTIHFCLLLLTTDDDACPCTIHVILSYGDSKHLCTTSPLSTNRVEPNGKNQTTQACISGGILVEKVYVKPKKDKYHSECDGCCRYIENSSFCSIVQQECNGRKMCELTKSWTMMPKLSCKNQTMEYKTLCIQYTCKPISKDEDNVIDLADVGTGFIWKRKFYLTLNSSTTEDRECNFTSPDQIKIKTISADFKQPNNIEQEGNYFLSLKGHESSLKIQADSTDGYKTLEDSDVQLKIKTHGVFFWLEIEVSCNSIVRCFDRGFSTLNRTIKCETSSVSVTPSLTSSPFTDDDAISSTTTVISATTTESVSTVSETNSTLTTVSSSTSSTSTRPSSFPKTSKAFTESSVSSPTSVSSTSLVSSTFSKVLTYSTTSATTNATRYIEKTTVNDGFILYISVGVGVFVLVIIVVVIIICKVHVGKSRMLGRSSEDNSRKEPNLLIPSVPMNEVYSEVDLNKKSNKGSKMANKTTNNLDGDRVEEISAPNNLKNVTTETYATVNKVKKDLLPISAKNDNNSTKYQNVAISKPETSEAEYSHFSHCKPRVITEKENVYNG